MLDLAEDLALADDHRVEAADHGEQVRDGAVLVVHVEVRSQRLEGHAGWRASSSDTSVTPPWNLSTSA